MIRFLTGTGFLIAGAACQWGVTPNHPIAAVILAVIGLCFWFGADGLDFAGGFDGGGGDGGDGWGGD